jgi:hypothetical protein
MKSASTSAQCMVRARSNKGKAEDKLQAIRALYMVTYNDSRSIIPQAVELFHAVGAILEGKPVECLELHQINKSAVLYELQHATTET